MRTKIVGILAIVMVAVAFYLHGPLESVARSNFNLQCQDVNFQGANLEQAGISNGVRCENRETICYLILSNISCMKK